MVFGGVLGLMFLIVPPDDLGYGDLGAYPASSNHGKLDTPNIDGTEMGGGGWK